MAGEIAQAQAAIESQLLALRSAVVKDAPADSALSSHLAMLTVLSQSVNGASPATLAQLRQAVAVAVAASSATVEQAASAMRDGGKPISAADYARATAELDARVAATAASDERHDKEAHDAAKQAGIDLTDLDRERAELIRQKAEAQARGDKLAERQADLAISQNTQAAMEAGLPGAADPAQYRRDMADQQSNVDIRRAALEAQTALDSKQTAQANGPAPNDEPAAPAATMQPADEKAVDVARTSTDAFASTINFSLNLGDTSQIALSAEPDAHTTVEVPKVQRSAGSAVARG